MRVRALLNVVLVNCFVYPYTLWSLRVTSAQCKKCLWTVEERVLYEFSCVMCNHGASCQNRVSNLCEITACTRKIMEVKAF